MGSGWGANTVIGLMAVGATRVYHIHSIPWYYGRGRKEAVMVNIPLLEGMLVILGGPLKEKWLYAQPRDEEMKEERIQFTLQLHADMHLAKDATSAPGVDWTEDCDGLGELDDAAETESRLVASADVQDAQPQDSSGQAADVQLEVSVVTGKSRWQRRDRPCSEQK